MKIKLGKEPMYLELDSGVLVPLHLVKRFLEARRVRRQIRHAGPFDRKRVVAETEYNEAELLLLEIIYKGTE